MTQIPRYGCVNAASIFFEASPAFTHIAPFTHVSFVDQTTAIEAGTGRAEVERSGFRYGYRETERRLRFILLSRVKARYSRSLDVG